MRSCQMVVDGWPPQAGWLLGWGGGGIAYGEGGLPAAGRDHIFIYCVYTDLVIYLRMCMFICICIRKCICICVYVYAYVYLYVYAFLFAYVYAYVL